MNRLNAIIIIICLCCTVSVGQTKKEKLKLAIDGLTHQHVATFFRSDATKYFELVGIAESDSLVVQRYQQKFGFEDSLVYQDLKALLEDVNPDVVAAFNPISEHIETVNLCAPKGIHVMVEKPLAINTKQAQKIQKMALDNNIHLITNYETTWYPTLHKVYEQVADGQIGEITKLEVRCGHKGPKEINIYPEFLEWLTDPKKNGGGALVDFGCYGVNIATYFNHGQRPNSVTAITSQNKPEIYPLVEDDAIMLLEYDTMQCIIQGSWNWPFNRKDFTIYGKTGYYQTIDDKNYGYRLKPRDLFKIEEISTSSTYKNPYSYLSGLIRGDFKELSYEPSALENNVLVVEILEAALESARTGKKVILN